MADPYIGGKIAFPCSGDIGRVLNDSFTSPIPEEAKHFNPSGEGHIGGTIQQVTSSKSKSSTAVQYDVCWDFSGLGITSTVVYFLLDGVREADKFS